MSFTLAQFLVTLTCLALPTVLGIKAPPPVVKNGFYRITNLNDGSVLTVTRSNTRPHKVFTSPWQNLPTQHWKVKTKFQEGLPLQIIRNEQIRDNEVTKEPNYESTGRDFIPLFWNFVPDPDNRPNTFILFNGIGCLVGNGEGQRITIAYCDESAPAPNELWEVEFLYSIPG